jgi:hypothetical protein
MGAYQSAPFFNPDFAVGFVMKGKNPIKTGVCADFLNEIIVNYAEVKKSRKCLCLPEFCPPDQLSGRACNRIPIAKSGFKAGCFQCHEMAMGE